MQRIHEEDKKREKVSVVFGNISSSWYTLSAVKTCSPSIYSTDPIVVSIFMQALWPRVTSPSIASQVASFKLSLKSMLTCIIQGCRGGKSAGELFIPSIRGIYCPWCQKEREREREGQKLSPSKINLKAMHAYMHATTDGQNSPGHYSSRHMDRTLRL